MTLNESVMDQDGWPIKHWKKNASGAYGQGFDDDVSRPPGVFISRFMTDAPFPHSLLQERLHYVSGHGDHMARFFISKKRCVRKQQLIRRTFSYGATGAGGKRHASVRMPCQWYFWGFFCDQTQHIQDSISAVFQFERASFGRRQTDRSGQETRGGVTAAV